MGVETRLDRLERLRAEATPGPWYQDHSQRGNWGIWDANNRCILLALARCAPVQEVAEYLLAAANALPALLELARAAKKWAIVAPRREELAMMGQQHLMDSIELELLSAAKRLEAADE